MELIDGKKIAAGVLEALKERVTALSSRGIQPGLAVVIIGDDPASHAYVRNKERTSREMGFHSVKHELPADTDQETVLRLVRQLNDDPAIHGILVQSPPPPQINESEVVLAINPLKDVDGFHPINVAKLAMEDPSALIPCTPLGCQHLLVASGIETSGANVVVLGRSMIVGKPMALLLMRKGTGGDATVTVAHSRTKNLPEVTRSADIVIAAIGRPEFLHGDAIREGAVVIDVGINRVEDASAPKGYRLVGDVHFESAAARARAITPVPGGVGPMTIAMLMRNTVSACEHICA